MRGISLLSEELLAPQEGLCSTEYVNSAPPYKIQWPGIFVPYKEKKGGGGYAMEQFGLRHYATSRKVADSIPDGVIGTFH